MIRTLTIFMHSYIDKLTFICVCVCVCVDTYAIFYSIHDRIAITQSWILPVKCFACLLVCYKIFTYVEIFLLHICNLYNHRILYWDICVINGQHNLTSAISYVASWEDVPFLTVLGLLLPLLSVSVWIVRSCSFWDGCSLPCCFNWF